MNQGRGVLARAVAAMGVVLMVAIGVSTSRAGTAGDSVAAEFRADVLKILQRTNSDSLGLSMGTFMAGAFIEQFRQQHPEMPDSVPGIIRDEIGRVLSENIAGMRERIVRTYSRHFSHEEVRGLLAFYQTPLGSKMIREMPLVLQESIADGQEWAQEIAPILIQRIGERLAPKPGGRTKS
jgi:hypothetical protein